jgi:GNAT superfamily N-acetyltransferase
MESPTTPACAGGEGSVSEPVERADSGSDSSRSAREADGSGRVDIEIRRATITDVPLILRFVRELADYERLADQVTATEEGLRETLFGDAPKAEVVFAMVDGEAAGFALFFHNYSTFLARSGLFLEDLYIRPEFRRRGIARDLLTRLAAIAVNRECGRFEWNVLDWNESAQQFYESLGARPMSDWTTYRLTGDALRALAARQDGRRADRVGD